MSAPELDGAEAEGVRFMLHVFYCERCPRVAHASEIEWWTIDGQGRSFPVDDVREASFAVVADVELCREGYEAARAARRRGWGA